MAGLDDNGSADNRDAHTLDDHMWGDFVPHEHGPDADHDHDDLALGPLEENPIWIQDNVTLHSVGIDIGSAGTQVVFSRIHLRRMGEDLTSRFVVVKRETLFQSPVRLTPYSDEHNIDDRALGEIIDSAYNAARIHPKDIDTGVVILTGEALRRENAHRIGTILAEKGGEFVTATAGNHMEAMLAAYGSGAARESHARGARILNVDIGGGTTKFGLVEKGKVLTTAAFHVGGRLIAVEDGRIVRLDPAGAHHASRAGFDWKVGDAASESDLARVAEGMADLLVAAVTVHPAPGEVERLFLTDPLGDSGEIAGVMFSGGVSEYIYAREEQSFGDLGPHLGRALRERAEAGAFGGPLLPAGECIRATALGASEYSVQLSGATGHISTPGKVLPRRNVPVLKPDFTVGETVDPAELAKAIRDHFLAFDLVGSDKDVALALEWNAVPDYQRLRAFAEGIRDGLAERIARGVPVYVMLDGDVAQTLGHILADELKIGVELMVIDGVVLRDFDYIDLGKIRLPSRTVPVTIKSLVFSEDPQGPGRKERIHHDGANLFHGEAKVHGHSHGQKHGHGHRHHHHDHHHGHDHDHGHGHDHHHDNESGTAR